jgi:hypothetical protein
MEISAVTNSSVRSIEDSNATLPTVDTVPCADFSATVNGKMYSSSVNESDAGYYATVPLSPPITVRGDSAEQVERTLAKLVDYYA